MLDKKIVSVLAVTLMLTMGIGFAFVGNDESEGTWNGPEVPLASLTMNAYQLWQAYDGGNGTDTYWVGYGTYVYIDHHTPDQDSDVLVVGVASDYGTGDTAGLSIRSSDVLTGNINKSNNGVIEITIEYRYSGGEDQIQVYLAVLDITSTQTNTWTAINLPANVFIDWGTAGTTGNTFYVEVGSTITITQANVTVVGTTFEYGIIDVTTGFGLSIPAGTFNLTGTVTQTGTITVEAYLTDQVDTEEWDITIEVVDSSHADVRMIGGETWTYTPTTNMTSVLSISGTAASWVSLTSGTVSGTAPTNTSVGQTYDLTITASTSDPEQNATQTVTFTVDPQITLTAPASYTVQFGTDTSNVLGSNFEDGTRNIYSITGGTATGFTVNAATGVLGWNNPAAGTITFTATSPYTYTSGATNTATATMDVTVTGILTASVSGTLYLVTGKVVPNTPAEAVTLNHNDVGSGTYTWAVVGTNTSGVTVASDGTLGGTPGNVGTYAVTVRCTSVVGGTTQTADTTLNIVIVQVLAFTSSPSSGTIR